jgi:LacI family transcriptional regulator
MQRAPQVTAIFAANDDCAIYSMRALNDLGLKVPDDVSVIGFDDIDVAQEVRPALTTVQVDKLLMGIMAVRQLRDRAENPYRMALSTQLSTQLIVRDSVRALT